MGGGREGSLGEGRPLAERFSPLFQEDLENGEEVATCPSCSLILRVIYDQVGAGGRSAPPCFVLPQSRGVGVCCGFLKGLGKRGVRQAGSWLNVLSVVAPSLASFSFLVLACCCV